MNINSENEQIKKLANDTLNDMQKDYSVVFDVTKNEFILRPKS